MWNSETSLKSLKNLPTKLSIDNLKNVQRIIDIDKYKSSMMVGRDLCGYYAPFCKNCDKSMIFPCAFAYIKMKQEQGNDFEIINNIENSTPNNTVINTEIQTVKNEKAELINDFVNDAESVNTDLKANTLKNVNSDNIEVEEFYNQAEQTVENEPLNQIENLPAANIELNENTEENAINVIKQDSNNLEAYSKSKKYIRIAVARRQRG